MGRGHFGTVWSAHALHDQPLAPSRESIRQHAEALANAPRVLTDRDRADRAWQRARGADDLLDLALNYQHSLLIASHCGPCPAEMIAAAHYRGSYFEPDGAPRFRPTIRRVTLRERLRRATKLRGSDLENAADFLRQLLAIDPATRGTATAALHHPWLSMTRSGW